MKKVVLIILSIILWLAPVTTWAYTIVAGMQFSANCGDYLKLSADASSIDIAEKHLSTAITYLEDNELTSGQTKVFVRYPKNDIGLWYGNLKDMQTQLRDMQTDGYTELEQSNMLMKLREVVLDGDGCLTLPFCISIVHTNYALIFWLNCLLWLPCWILGFFVAFLASEEC